MLFVNKPQWENFHSNYFFKFESRNILNSSSKKLLLNTYLLVFLGHILIYLTLVWWVITFHIIYINYIYVDEMLDERSKLPKKIILNSEKCFQTVINVKLASIKVPENLGHGHRDSEIRSSDTLEVLLTLSLCWMNAPNYRQNDGLLETYPRVWSMLKVYR